MMEWKRPRPATYVIWGVLAVLVALIVVMAKREKPTEEVAAAEEKAVPVVVMAVASHDVPDVVTVPGRVEPVVEADLAAETAGRIVDVMVDKGDRVEVGEVVMKIDDRLWSAALERARIELRDATRSLERWEELRKTGAVSESDTDDVRRRKAMADVAVAEAEVHVSQCALRSPMAGLVDDRYVEPGEHAGEGQPAVKVIDISRAKVALEVAERDILAVRRGDVLAFTVDVLPERSFEGEVLFVSSMASRESNSFRVELGVDNSGETLKPGMIVEVALERGVFEGAVVVPLTAVIPQGGEHVVYVTDGDRAVCRVVKLDSIVGSEAILSSGLAAGEMMIVVGQRSLVDGELVEVRSGEAGSPGVGQTAADE